MKKYISAILIAAMLISLMGGCAKKDSGEDGQAAAGQEQTELNGEKTQTDENGDAVDGDGGILQQSDSGTNDTEGKKPGSTASGSQSAVTKPGTSGPSTQSGSSSGNVSSVTAGDIDPDEVEHFESDGENDTKYEGKNDGLKYVTTADTTVSDFTVTSKNYDEKALTLPVMNIHTSTGEDVTSKTEYVPAQLSISNTSSNYAIKSAAVDIRGRGNSTWKYFTKKPYKIKFTVNTDLFGMGAAKKWVLLANSLDETMLRNYLAFTLGKSLGLEYTSDAQYLNVFINGQYKGVYLLCEQVQEHTSRVNIGSATNGQLDTGYLIEGINSTERVEYKTFKLDDVDGMSLGKMGNFRFIVKSPDNTQCTDKQLGFIKDYVAKTNEAIFKQNWSNIKKYVDVDTFVNMFLLDEVLMNQDMGYSFYMYKKAGGKLCMGPMWDFDQSCGVSSHGGAGYKGWYAGSELQWFSSLIEMPEFKALVASRYKEIKAEIHAMLGKIDETVNKYSFDFAMSNYVFNTFGSTTRWRTMYEIACLKTYKQHIVYLKTWLTNRFIWMENQLGV